MRSSDLCFPQAFCLHHHQKVGLFSRLPINSRLRRFLYVGLMILAHPCRASRGFFSSYFIHNLTVRGRLVAFSVAIVAFRDSRKLQKRLELCSVRFSRLPGF